MRFNVVTIDPPNSPWSHFLFDLVRMISYGLEELGHTCTLTRNTPEKEAINILLGVHHLATTEAVDDLLDSKWPYVVYQTEIVQGRAINQVALEDRFEKVLLPLLRGASAVWDTSEESLVALRELGIGAEMLRFGHCKRLEEIRHREKRDLDFLFYGSVTERRRRILDELARLGYRVKVVFDDAALFRNDLISRSEVVLSMRQSDAMAHLPQARILYLVNNGALVVGETGLGQAPLEDLFVHCAPEEFIERCRQIRADPNRYALAKTFQERFRARPMSGCLAPLVASLEGRLR